MKVLRHSEIALAAMAVTLFVAQLGCQFQSPIQSLPGGGGGLNDDIEYFEPGPEFKQRREEAAIKAYKADLVAQQAGRQGP